MSDEQVEPRISVFIIAKDAVPRIRDTLESVKWADEIVVLDSGSSDDTVAVCKEYTSNVFETDWLGFGVQLQRSVDRCGGDWLISIDADEVMTEALKDEILSAIDGAPDDVDGFSFPRLTHIHNIPIRYSGWRPDYVLRVFRKGSVQYPKSLVHAGPVVVGKSIKLKNDLLHYSYDNLSQMLDKANWYSTLGARQMYAADKRSGMGKAVGRGLWAFFRCYVLRRGFLDGRYGIVIAVSSMAETFFKYAKLALIEREGGNLFKKAS